jgi:type IV secretory pathway VirB3-like protein
LAWVLVGFHPLPARPLDKRKDHTMTKRRGIPVEINSALNKPTTKFGIDYRLLGICLFVSITVFLFASKILSCLLLPMMVLCGNLLTRKEAKMFRLWLLSFRQASFYDPGKRRRQ